LPPSAVQLAAGLFQILECVPVVGEHEPSIAAPRIDLEVIVVTIQVWGSDLHPVVDLPKGGLLPQPRRILIQESLNVGDHVNDPLRIKGISAMLQYCMKSWSVRH
jgi:hypothetical protein